MAGSQISEVVQHLHRTVLVQDGAGLSDGQLLERFVSRREPASLAALVRRHGPMVWGVCRRVLRNLADAEDAFQAAFLVLLRKAASVTPREMVANWLYGVAYQTALKARQAAAKRQVRERQVTVMPELSTVEQDLWRDVQPLLDRELSRLPDKYRVAVVLCDVEGKTRKEAARQLGLPEGTMASRLTRARTLLAKRLRRHGLAVAGGALATFLAENAAASVPASVMTSTLKTATIVAAGRGASQSVISAKVAALTHGVLTTMLLDKLKTLAALALAIGFVVAIGTFGICLLDTPTVTAAADAKLDPPKAPPRRGKRQPVVIREDVHVHRVAWSANDKTVATVAVAYEVVEFTDEHGNKTDKGALWPSSTIKLWDAGTGRLVRSLDEEKHTYLSAIAISPDGKTAAVSVSKHHEDPLKFQTEVRVLDARTWALKHKVDAAGFASALVFSPDGTRLALGGRSRFAENGSFVKLWDVGAQKVIGGTKESKEPQLPLGGGGRVTCLAFSGDGRVLAGGDENGKLWLFDGRTGEGTRVFAGHREWVSGVGFSPDGKTLVSGSADKTLKLWETETAKLLRTLEANKAPVTALAFSRDRRFFATAGGENNVIVWDAKTGEPKMALPDQILPVGALAFSPDGSTLAIAAGTPVRSKIRSGPGRCPPAHPLAGRGQAALVRSQADRVRLAAPRAERDLQGRVQEEARSDDGLRQRGEAAAGRARSQAGRRMARRFE